MATDASTAVDNLAMDSSSAGATTSPTAAITLSDIQRIIDQQTRVIDEKLGSLRADITEVRTSVQTIATDIAEVKQRTLTLEATCEKLSEKHDDLVESVEDLEEDLKDLQTRYEDELDKLEAFSRRDNLRLFGDLTTRQHRKIQEHRDRGLRAKRVIASTDRAKVVKKTIILPCVPYDYIDMREAASNYDKLEVYENKKDITNIYTDLKPTEKN
nr:hypothetical protein BaRGS_033114 [Batillaria attramentaria]